MARTTPSYAMFPQLPETTTRYSLAPRPNMIDNGWFTINQRGATVMTATTSAIWIDRWRFQSRTSSSSTLTWTTDGLAANVPSGNLQIQQRFAENRFDPDKTYRVSALLSSGDIYTSVIAADSAAHYIGGSANPYFGIIIYPDRITLRFYAAVTTNNMVLRALKIENTNAGASIAFDAEPDYATELLKCQRYMYVIQPMGANTDAAVGFASNNGTGGQFNIGVSVPAAMANIPTLAFLNGTYSNFYVNVQGVDYACTATPTISAMSSPNLPVIEGTFNTTSKVFSLAYLKSSGVLALIAEGY